MFEKTIEYHNISTNDTCKLFTYTDSTYSASGITIHDVIAPNNINFLEVTSSYHFNLINHLFNTNYNNPTFFSLKSNYSKQNNYVLQKSSRILSIPVKLYGKRILPGSFTLTDLSTGSISIKDDSNGNLIDNNVSTASFVDEKKLLSWISFDDGYKADYIEKSTFVLKDNSFYLNNLNIQYPTFSSGKNGKGYKLNLNGNSCYGYFEGSEYLTFSDNDFTISFWINIPATQLNLTESYNTIICKRNNSTKEYPFEIAVYNSTHANAGKLLIKRKGYHDNQELNDILLVSTTTLNNGALYHIAVVREASTLKLYINGTLNNSISDYSTPKQTYNTCNVFVGGRGGKSNQTINSNTLFSGSIDELRIYKEAVNVANLYNNPYNTNIVGNIFYETGIVLFNNLSGSYANILNGSSATGFSFNYRAVSEITEHEIVIRKRANDFNFTMNPSTRQRDDGVTLISSLTSSIKDNVFVPYITNIGLYNDKNELLVVAKLKNPIKSIKDLDLFFTIRFDM